MKKDKLICFGDVHLGNVSKSEMKKQLDKLRKQLRSSGISSFAFTVTDTIKGVDNV